MCDLFWVYTFIEHEQAVLNIAKAFRPKVLCKASFTIDFTLFSQSCWFKTLPWLGTMEIVVPGLSSSNYLLGSKYGIPTLGTVLSSFLLLSKFRSVWVGCEVEQSLVRCPVSHHYLHCACGHLREPYPLAQVPFYSRICSRSWIATVVLSFPYKPCTESSRWKLLLSQCTFLPGTRCSHRPHAISTSPDMHLEFEVGQSTVGKAREEGVLGDSGSPGKFYKFEYKPPYFM